MKTQLWPCTPSPAVHGWYLPGLSPPCLGSAGDQTRRFTGSGVEKVLLHFSHFWSRIESSFSGSRTGRKRGEAVDGENKKKISKSILQVWLYSQQGGLLIWSM